METLEQRAERKTNLFSYRNGYSTAKDAYIEGYKDCQAIFDNLPKMKAWIARDRKDVGGYIWMYFNSKPDKMNFEGRWENWYDRYCINEDQLPEGCNPKWTDEEPIEVELTINLKKGE